MSFGNCLLLILDTLREADVDRPVQGTWKRLCYAAMNGTNVCPTWGSGCLHCLKLWIVPLGSSGGIVPAESVSSHRQCQ